MRRPELAWTALLAVLVLGPLLASTGFWLVGDMVFVPHQPWKDAWWGGDGLLPRAVPMDALVSGLTHLVPGQVVQRVLLLLAVALGGLGAARMARELGHRGAPAVLAAVTTFVWSPWAHDRLQMGQWSILAGAWLLPWVVVAAHRLRTRPIRVAGPGLGLVLVASAVCGPASGLTAIAVALVVGVGGPCGLRRAGVVLVSGLVACLPWLVPGLLADRATISTDGVFAGFAPRAESSLGLLASLLGTGGTWKTSVAAPERGSAVIVGVTALLALGALAALAAAWWTGRRQVADDASTTRGRVLALGVGALVLTLLPRLPGGRALLEHGADTLPALAVLRDSQRFLAPLLLALALGAAVVVERVRVARPALVAAYVVGPLLLLPSLAWGGLGDLRPAHYPAAWDAAADAVGADPGTTVVLPWRGLYRGFAWNDERAVLDPAPRYLPGRVVIDDRLVLRGAGPDGGALVVPPEDPAVPLVDRALRGADAAERARRLAALGVRWVLVEGDPGTPGIAGDLPAGTRVVDADGLVLIRLAATPFTTPAAGSGEPERAVSEDLASTDRSDLPLFVSDLLTAVFAVCMLSVTSVRRRRGALTSQHFR